MLCSKQHPKFNGRYVCGKYVNVDWHLPRVALHSQVLPKQRYKLTDWAVVFSTPQSNLGNIRAMNSALKSTTLTTTCLASTTNGYPFLTPLTWEVSILWVKSFIFCSCLASYCPRGWWVWLTFHPVVELWTPVRMKLQKIPQIPPTPEKPVEPHSGSFVSKVNAYWYKFRVFTTKHHLKLLCVWAGTTMISLSIMQYERMQGRPISGKTTSLKNWVIFPSVKWLY